MSSSHLKPFCYGDLDHTHPDSLLAPDNTLPFVGSGDRALDAALKSVPLPDGLLARLGQMARAMPDEVSDPVDYLGC